MPEVDFEPMTSRRTPIMGSSVPLCELCSRSLLLDDSRVHFTVGTPSDAITPWCEIGGDLSSRIVTVPDLPELSVSAEQGCHFCAVLKRALVGQYRNQWCRYPMQKIFIDIRYVWSVQEDEEDGSTRGASLHSLNVSARRPGQLNPKLDLDSIDFPISAKKGEHPKFLNLQLLILGCW